MPTSTLPKLSLVEEGENKSLTSRVYDAMRNDILSGAIPPGQKLKIEELSRNYDVGNSPIREALSLLTSDLLVERLEQRGFRVVEVSAQEFKDILKTRVWLETLAIREAIANNSPDWEENIILATYRLSRTPRSLSDESFVVNPEWEKLHKEFHMALISGCGSSILLRFCDQLYDQNTRYRHLTGPMAYPTRDIAAEHKALSDAVLDRNADLAVRLLSEHYESTIGFLQKFDG